MKAKPHSHYVRPEPDVAPISISESEAFPNNPRLPLLFYRQIVAIPADHPDPAALFEELFAANGWTGSWRNGIYSYHHFHSTAHEVLGIFRGEATVRFGGPGGVEKTVRVGDVVLIPAGVSHQRIRSTADLGVVGAYPDGQVHNMCYGKQTERPQADQDIAAVPRPKADPVYGPHGPLSSLWPKPETG